MSKVIITEVGEDQETGDDQKTSGYYVRFYISNSDATAKVEGIAYLSGNYVWTYIGGSKPEEFQIADHVRSFIENNYNAVSLQLAKDPFIFFVNNPKIDRTDIRTRYSLKNQP